MTDARKRDKGRCVGRFMSLGLERQDAFGRKDNSGGSAQTGSKRASAKPKHTPHTMPYLESQLHFPPLPAPRAPVYAQQEHGLDRRRRTSTAPASSQQTDRPGLQRQTQLGAPRASQPGNASQASQPGTARTSQTGSVHSQDQDHCQYFTPPHASLEAAVPSRPAVRMLQLPNSADAQQAPHADDVHLAMYQLQHELTNHKRQTQASLETLHAAVLQLLSEFQGKGFEVAAALDELQDDVDGIKSALDTQGCLVAESSSKSVAAHSQVHSDPDSPRAPCAPDAELVSAGPAPAQVLSDSAGTAGGLLDAGPQCVVLRARRDHVETLFLDLCKSMVTGLEHLAESVVNMEAMHTTQHQRVSQEQRTLSTRQEPLKTC